MVNIKDLSGQSYGSWKILNRDGSDKSGFAVWLCKCKCGKLKHISSVGIVHKKAKHHCGCDQDWTGRKFGKLTVLNKVCGLGNHAAKFLCKCDCGIEKIIWGGSLHQGSVISCGCFRSRSEEHSCYTIVMSCYHRHAKDKGIEFQLEREQFIKLASSPCFYCGKVNSNTLKRKYKLDFLTLKYNGIDRMDNNKGYTIDNCVSCCKNCNLMKRGMSFIDWKNHMEKILQFLQSKETTALYG